MQKTIYFNTKDLPTQLHITVKTPSGANVRIVGYDPEKPNTVYFFLEQKIRLKTLTLPMPISPKKLAVSISSQGEFSIHHAKIGMIKPSKKMLRLTGQTKNFIRHAFDFAESCGYLEQGNTYSNDAGEYPIHYYPTLQKTPARIHKETGHIQVSAEDFRRYTIPMRMFVLLHEWMHWSKSTGSEIKCDLEAARVFLGLGFPKYEAMVAVTEVLHDNHDHITRVKALQKFIREYN
ncbi:hypothetical protein [uncultured Microscilla sp.]|uniref:hypothetical protein n=1 Tax=uncultured Microscilla sp. TaxID=432653 RepID=UPI0026260862|nr:hypothetical protein [uncultured Microscilla sp.]